MRHIVTEAIILHAKVQAEYHKQIIAFSPDFGLFSATAFGAYKSKSRMVSSTDPFCKIRMQIYRNPVKELFKICDVEVIDAFSGMREAMHRILAATLLTELLNTTHSGGEPAKVYALTAITLKSLSQADETLTNYILIQYLYRFMSIGGFFEIPGSCVHCGMNIGSADNLFWTGMEGDFACASCNNGSEICLGPGALGYMRNSLCLPFSQACNIKVDTLTADHLRGFILALIADTTGKPIKTPWV